MNYRFTLEVKDFAKIKEARIDFKPLTVFVGDNNSGKSYLASLLWGVINSFRLIKNTKSEIKIINEAINESLFLSEIFNTKNISGKIKISDFNIDTVGCNPLYLPAARTGFMLTYKALMDSFLNHLSFSNQEKELVKFPNPTISFLRRFNAIDTRSKGLFEDIAAALETQILQGKIIPKPSVNLNEFTYTENGQNETLPLYLTSSLVTELTPLIVFLKYSSPKYDALIIEEPEAHLHPTMQRILIRNLVKLVNRGIPVIITTHSDIILQQINNLSSLYRHPERRTLQPELGYSDEELIDSKNISAYQLNQTSEGTVVKALQQIDNNGFEIPTFNEAILALTRESRLLQWD